MPSSTPLGPVPSSSLFPMQRMGKMSQKNSVRLPKFSISRNQASLMAENCICSSIYSTFILYLFSEEEYIEEEDDGWIDEDVDDPSMRLYLDSANIKEWEKWAETGMFYGFTTNPTILKRDGVQCTLQAMRNLSRYADELEMEELQLQAWGLTWNDIYSCGLDLFELDSSRVVIKVPLTPAGVRAANRLLDDNVPVTFTGVYSAHQAVSAVSMGVNYVAPYLGRMNDAGKNVSKKKYY